MQPLSNERLDQLLYWNSLEIQKGWISILGGGIFYISSHLNQNFTFYHFKHLAKINTFSITLQPCSEFTILLDIYSVLFSLVQLLSCVRLWELTGCSTPGLPVHQLLELAQTHIHPVGDAIQPSHPLLSPSPPAPNPSQHQSLFQWVNSLQGVAKVLEFCNLLNSNIL